MAHKRTPRDEAEPDLFGGLINEPPASASTEFSPEIPVHISAEKIAAKADDAFKTISETADMLALPQHVLRFWETKFSTIKPLKLRGGRRYYRPQDIEALEAIKQLLYKEGYTIKGAKRAIAQNKKKPSHMAAPKKPRLTPPSNRKREDLKRIHGELLELRGLIASLPNLT